MRDADEIAGLFWEYRQESGDAKKRMSQIANIADGDVVIPLPELGAIDRPAVANLTHIGIQGLAQRFSTVQPDVEFKPRRLTKPAIATAELKTRWVNWWWSEDKMPLLDAQAGRYMFGYGSSPRRVDWSIKNDRPFLSVPSPLHVYAPRPTQANDICPPHAIAAREMSVPEVRKRWSDREGVARFLADASDAANYWVLEYADDVEIHLVLCGEAHSSNPMYADTGGRALSLEWVPNLAGRSPWVVPGLIHLNRPQGHFDQLVGMYQAAGLLTALELQQAARSVFQETWIVARPGEIPNVIENADPMVGTVGMLEGGDIRTIAPDPQFGTHMAQDRLMESQRATASIPADFGGQAASNVRTGRRAAQLIDSAIDPALAEAQTAHSLAKEEEISIAADFDKAYSAGRSKVFVTQWRGKYSEDTYTPEKLWGDENDSKCLVNYPIHGADANGSHRLDWSDAGNGAHFSKARA